MDTPDTSLLGSLFSAWSIMVSLTVIGSTWLLNRVVHFTVQRLAAARGEHRLLLLRFLPIISIILWAVASAIIVTLVFAPNSQTVAALVGASVFAIGFAAQDFFKNILGGLIILFDRPFQVGDKVEVQPYYGEVVSIGLRSTKMVTNDDSLVTVPNAKMLEQSVSNGNAGALDFQVVTDVYLPAHTDVILAEELAWESAATSPYIFLDKPIAIRITDEYKERVLTRVRIKAYVLDIRLETLFQSDISKRAKRAFMRAGLLPQHTKLTARPAADISPAPPEVVE